MEKEVKNERKYLSAWTSPESSYPPYISINYVNTMIEITVRSSRNEDGSPGDIAVITMNTWRFDNLFHDALKELRKCIQEITAASVAD